MMTSLVDHMTAQGCSAYVKTIYVGFELNGEMVAAAYGHASNVEIALALDEAHSDSRLIDATHLTWRTLPVALVVRSTDEVESARPLLAEACVRVAEGGHNVVRDNDHFINARARRRAKRQH